LNVKPIKCVSMCGLIVVHEKNSHLMCNTQIMHVTSNRLDIQVTL
jgi:hypothetical protein